MKQMFNSLKKISTTEPKVPERVVSQKAEQAAPPNKCQTLHRSLRSSLDIIEHPPGEFDSNFEADLTAWVLSGSGHVSLSDGRKVKLQPGRTIFLPRGLQGHWVVIESMRTASVLIS